MTQELQQNGSAEKITGGREQRPSPLDALIYEQSGLVVGAILHLTGAPARGDELCAHVTERLSALPSLSVVMVGEGLAAQWVQRRPQVDQHIREHELAVGGSVEEATRELSRAPFPADAPRWDLTVIHGYAPDRYAIFYRAHHGLQDGGAVAHTVETLFSADPVPIEQSSGVVRALTDPAAPSWRDKVGALKFLARTTATTDLWPHPTYRYSQERALNWSAVPTEVLRSAGRRYGGTANDAYVTSVARTFAGWTAVHATHASRSLPLSIALNIRRPVDVATPGNQTLAGRVIVPDPGMPIASVLPATIEADRLLKSATHREALRRLIQGAPRRLVNMSMSALLAPERGAIFCSNVAFRHPLQWQGSAVSAIDPLVLLPLGAPAAALLYSYRGRSSTVFVTDPALPQMDDLHTVWQREAHQLAESDT
ncbi:wax ester/triacylglycerol synthase domain-containing protein [Nocardia sp. NBC_01329]|uniref:wax ester/triacylglycerol synthase domain-containing protein n=1 Tax=Nocardia sp. NBC_01329 TaxID=2903594 RepID=UPI002E10E0CB|nr:wax ester/triacylglycerol synthase family O-acyltransferase [Nocardia sp. NBC_01329]